MRVLLVSTYELGRQPFGLASPAAWLAARGHQVACAGSIHRMPVRRGPCSRGRSDRLLLADAHGHASGCDRDREVPTAQSGARTCAVTACMRALNESYLRKLGCSDHSGRRVRAGAGLAGGAAGAGRSGAAAPEPRNFARPAAVPAAPAALLPPLDHYAQLRVNGTSKRSRLHGSQPRVQAFVPALSRWCRCIAARFRVVQAEVVLEDIRRQVGAGAEHITFGDPDFFNGPTHAMRIVEACIANFRS